jgi:hypothetical protein
MTAEIGLVDAIGETPVSLELRSSRTAADAPARLDDRIVLGAPAVRLLLPDTVIGDDELRAFLTAEAAQNDYWLMQFTCTFEHDEQLPLTTAWLQLTLQSSGARPVANAMEPAKLSTNRAVNWSARLRVPCVFAELEADGKHVSEEIFCEASREGTPRPSWKFFATSSETIRGLQRLRMVVRGPAGCGLAASAQVGATVYHRRFGRRPLAYEVASGAIEHWLDVAAPGAELKESSAGIRATNSEL